MKPAISERLDDLISAGRRLQYAIDSEPPAWPLPASLLCRVVNDVMRMVHRLEGHTEVVQRVKRQRAVAYQVDRRRNEA
jgi:hypothetical protein